MRASDSVRGLAHPLDHFAYIGTESAGCYKFRLQSPVSCTLRHDVRSAHGDVSIPDRKNVRIAQAPEYLSLVPWVARRNISDQLENDDVALEGVENFVDFPATTAGGKLALHDVSSSDHGVRHLPTVRSPACARRD